MSFSSAGISFLPFFDEQCCRNVRLNPVIGPCILMSLSFSVRKKRSTVVPHDIDLFRCIYADDDKLVIHECVDVAVVVIVDCEIDPKTISWEPNLSAKLPAYRINWLRIDNIGCDLKKYRSEDKTGKKIEEDLSSLLSNFSTSEIRFTLVATLLAKLELNIKDLPVRKNKLIELFSQLIFDNMSILANLTKTAKRYV
jgi:hypothetical protein